METLPASLGRTLPSLGNGSQNGAGGAGAFVEDGSPQGLDMYSEGTWLEIALGNPQVLSSIFHHSQVQDLKIIRLVSKSWRDVSLLKWRNDATLKVLPFSTPDDNLTNYKLTDGVCLRDMCDVYRGNFERIYIPGIVEHPFIRYKVLDMTLPPIPKEVFKTDFWTLYGSQMRYLNLDNCFMRKDMHLKALEDILLLYCPKLTELVVRPYTRKLSTDDQNSSSETPDEKKLLKKILPPKGVNTNLTSITIGQFRHYPSSSCKDLFLKNFKLAREFLLMVPKLKKLRLDSPAQSVLQALKYPLKKGTKQSPAEYIVLESLDLTQKMGDFHFQMLLDYIEAARPPLQYLAFWISLIQAEDNPAGVRQIMNLSKDTLTRLDLGIHTDDGDIGALSFADLANIYSSLSKLTYLRIMFRYSYTSPFISFDFGSLKEMSDLKIFRFESPKNFPTGWAQRKISAKELEFGVTGNRGFFDPEEEGREDEDLKGLMKLEHLEELHYYLNLTPTCLRVMGKWFPNLRVIETILDDETFPVVFQVWPKIKKVGLLRYSEVNKKSISNRLKRTKGKVQIIPPPEKK